MTNSKMKTTRIIITHGTRTVKDDGTIVWETVDHQKMYNIVSSNPSIQGRLNILSQSFDCMLADLVLSELHESRYIDVVIKSTDEDDNTNTENTLP